MAYTSYNQGQEKISIVARELEKKGVIKTYSSYIPSFVLIRIVAFLAVAIDQWILTYLLGSSALGVVSRLLPFRYWILFVFGLFDGFHIYISNSFGENDLDKVNTLFTMTFYSILILTVISTVLCYYASTILYLLDDSSWYLLKHGHRYLKGFIWGLFPMIALSALSYVVRIDGSKYLPIYANIAVIICNIFLDLAMIGKFRYLGAGIATSISYWIGLFILSMHFLKKDNTYRLLATLKFPSVSFKKLVSLTCPGIANQTARLCNVSILTFLGFSSFGIIFGTVHSIYNVAQELIYSILGVIEASKPLIGLAYGQKDYKTLHNILHVMYEFALLFLGTLCLFLFVFPQGFPLLMNVNHYDESFAPACTAIRLLAIQTLLYTPNFIYIKYYQQVGHEKFISIISLLKPTLFVIPFYYLFVNVENTNGFWWSNILRESITFAILLTFHLRQNRKKAGYRH